MVEILTEEPVKCLDYVCDVVVLVCVDILSMMQQESKQAEDSLYHEQVVVVAEVQPVLAVLFLLGLLVDDLFEGVVGLLAYT